MNVDHRSPTPRPDAPRPRVGLALGAGGAKGLAHIGVIEEIEQRGFEIVAIAGCSMGALIGGIHAAGKLDVYRDWVTTLAKLDVLKLADWTFSGGGLIKGDRIIETLRRMLGELEIDTLPINFTAVATDLERHREVWLTHGSLFDAIRASIAIPSLFRPHVIHGRRLVDGALLNPVPVTPLMRTVCDYIIAVSVDGPAETATPERDVVAAEHGEAVPAVNEGGYRQKMAELVGRLVSQGENKVDAPGAFALLTQALDMMQTNLARLRLAVNQPDLLIAMPRNASTSYEFYRARELIDLGRARARRALDEWQPMPLPERPAVSEAAAGPAAPRD